MTETRLGLLRCGTAAVLFGVSAPAASRLTGDLHAVVLAGLLYVGAALAVTPVVVRHRPSRSALRGDASSLVTAIVLGGAVGPVFLTAGLGATDAATASLLLNLELVFTTVVAAVFFHEQLGRRIVMGTVLVLGASLVLGWRGTPDVRWGGALIAAACLCWAVDNSVTASIDRLAPSHITFAKGLVAGSTNLVIGLFLAGSPPLGATLVALAVGALGYGASITLWVAGARQLGAARGQLVFATAPFVGAVVAWVVLDDPVTSVAVVAAVVAAAGVALVVGSDHAHDHVHEPLTHDHDHSHDDGHHGHEHDPPVHGRHRHAHAHTPNAHVHPHVPDLHHRHGHAHAHDADGHAG